MSDDRPPVLIVDLVLSSVAPVAGDARVHSGPHERFSGWSELFAVLERLISASSRSSGR